MEVLKYKVIKTEKQYYTYCHTLENLLTSSDPQQQDEVELLTLLIENWDAEHSSLQEVDPITLLKSLMNERNLRAKDLVNILGVSKGLVSDILNRKKGLSKEVIRILARYFSVSQSAFNRPYNLVKDVSTSTVKNASFTKPKKLKTI